MDFLFVKLNASVLRQLLSALLNLIEFNVAQEYFLIVADNTKNEIFLGWSRTKNLNPIDDFSNLLLRHIISEREQEEIFLPSIRVVLS